SSGTMFETESAPSGNYGEILFFPRSKEGPESQPSEERHSVSAGQTLGVCVRFTKEASSYLDHLSQNTIGYRLILEDSENPPHRLEITLGNHQERMRPDAQGCFGEDWKIPDSTVPGIYQVADLLWATRDQSYYSLRSHLYEFSQVDELNIQNPDLDTEPPQLVGIKTYGLPPYKMVRYPGVLKVRVEQAFQFADKGSGVDKKSLTVVYKISIDGVEQAVKEAQCRPTPPVKDQFRCVLSFTNPEVNWGLRKVNLALHSISVQDRTGNRLLLSGEEEICSRVGGATTSFDFERR